jgi:hypothetical protein
MSTRLRNYLAEAYKSQRNFSLPRKLLRRAPIQIDDQDDTDSINDFCNIFCSVAPKDRLTIELSGRFPMPKELSDIVEIYGGRTNAAAGKMVITLSLGQIEVLRDISDRLRKTSFMGDTVNNPSWLPVSARTISSLYRFLRIIKEYKQTL